MDRIQEFEFRTRDRLEHEVRQLEKRSRVARRWAGVANTQKYEFASNARTNGSQTYQQPEQRMQLERVLTLCRLFDLPENFLQRPLETYSRGEQKKIDIARALSEENDVIFLDEPLNYMDVYFREQLEKAILDYRPTIVFVEHDSRFGRNVSNKIMELPSGAFEQKV